MKSFLVTLVALLALLAVPSMAVTDAGLEWDIDTVISNTQFDTLVTASDSTTIMDITSSFKYNGKAPINYGGWTYYVVLGRLAGDSKDTSNLCVAVDAYTKDDSLIGRARSDTSADRSEAYFFKLPINTGDALCGDAFVGDKYRLKIMNVSVGGTAAASLYIGKVEIRKCRPIQLQRMIGR